MTRSALLVPISLALAVTSGCHSSGGPDGGADGTEGGPGGSAGNDVDPDAGTVDAADGETEAPPLTCGNGVLDPDEGEECEGQDFGGLSCADFGGDTGSLSCSGCSIDSSGCGLAPATKFGDASTWSLPEGGDATYGFYGLGGVEWDVGDQSWSVADLTGDGLPDLVITNEDGLPILGGGGQYWWVHPSTGSGFGSASPWTLPEGGDGTYGFYAMGGTEWDVGDQSWSVADLTGDGLPDLVITNEDGLPILGSGGQYWWLHPNTGNGFGDAVPWALPEGGDGTYGFYAMGGVEWDVGDQSWSVADLTGDGLPDLVVTNEDGMPILGGGGQYWWVHPNTGDGFGEAMPWALPDGGDSTYGFYAMGGVEWDVGDQSWSVSDLTGDGLPDLVITNEDGMPILGGGGQYWWLHANTGDGFGDASPWGLPDGGDATYGFYALAGVEWDVGDQSWSTADLTGDGRPDLVVTNEDGEPILGNDGQYWWMHANTGSGFGSASPWGLPDGGDGTYGFYSLGGTEWDVGDQSWSTLDLTGDRRPDLVVTNEDGLPIAGPSWIVYRGEP